MALLLATTDRVVNLVHTSDPEVKNGKKEKGADRWLSEDEAKASDDATRIGIKPLSGLEFNTIASIEDKAQQSLEVLKAGVISIDGKRDFDKSLLEQLPYKLAAGLESKILDVSLG